MTSEPTQEHYFVPMQVRVLGLSLYAVRFRSGVHQTGPGSFVGVGRLERVPAEWWRRALFVSVNYAPEIGSATMLGDERRRTPHAGW